MEYKRFIAITPEECRFLQKAFNVSDPTVRYAVKYERSNDIHRRIRKLAIERGNPRMVVAPEFDTIYLRNREDADGECKLYMMQSFRNGSTLEACLDTGTVEVRDRKGREAGRWENVMLSEIPYMQEAAQKL